MFLISLFILISSPKSQVLSLKSQVLLIIHHNLPRFHLAALLVEELHGVVAVGKLGAVDLEVRVVATGLVDQASGLVIETDSVHLGGILNIDVE